MLPSLPIANLPAIEADELDIETERTGTHAVITITGEIDAYSAPQLRHVLREQIDQGVERMVLDLRGVAFIDSTGIGTLVLAKRGLGTSEKSICLVVDESQTTVRRVFEITSVDRVMPIHATVADAVSDCLGEPAA
jgi:anti-sigma B factor antagonist